MKRLFAFITAVIMLFTVNVCAETENRETEEVYKIREYDIGDGITIFQNSDKKWGACGNGFYIEAEYYLPCMLDNYYEYDGVFTLALSADQAISAEYPEQASQTYFVFNNKGELIKTLTYTAADFQAEKPCGCTFSFITSTGAIGSNIIFGGMPAYYETSILTQYIKRLYSENIAGEGYYGIRPYAGVGFTAVENETDKKCILNPDGSFKEYIEEENG
ncbi:MAG: hypothetical protein LUG66_07555 [Clostridiales bacterium]|nr:hypothetical protein [Clostridiales bacterium]